MYCIKKSKSWISLLMILAMTMALSSFSNASTQPPTETESNDNYSIADVMYDDGNNYGYLSSQSDIDWWKITFTESGYANYWLGDLPLNPDYTSGNGEYQYLDYDLFLYDSDGVTLLDSSTTSDTTNELIRYDVVANKTYYLCVSSPSDYSTSETYKLRAKRYAAETARIFTTTLNGLNTNGSSSKVLS